MAIEVREFVLKLMVEAGQESSSSAAATAASSNASGGEDIIKTCVEKVLEILKDKNER
jgi:hypothetical protein